MKRCWKNGKDTWPPSCMRFFWYSCSTHTAVSSICPCFRRAPRITVCPGKSSLEQWESDHCDSVVWLGKCRRFGFKRTAIQCEKRQRRSAEVFHWFPSFSEEYHSDVFLDMQSQQIIREQKQKYNMKSTHPLLRSPGILKSFQLVQCKQLWRLGCTVCTVVSKNQQFVKTLWRFNQCYMPRRSSRPKRILTLSEVTWNKNMCCTAAAIEPPLDSSSWPNENNNRNGYLLLVLNCEENASHSWYRIQICVYKSKEYM